MVPKLRRNQGLSRFATPRQPRRDQRERRSGATNSSRWSRMIRPIETKLSQSSCPTRRSCVRCGSRWRRRASVQKVARAAQRPAHRAGRRARRHLETRVAEVVSSFCADPVGRDLRDHRLCNAPSASLLPCPSRRRWRRRRHRTCAPKAHPHHGERKDALDTVALRRCRAQVASVTPRPPPPWDQDATRGRQ